MSDNINPVYHMMHSMTVTDWVVVAAGILLVVLLVLGIVKKTMWMIGIAVVLGIGIFFANPAKYEVMKDNVVEFVDNLIRPVEDDDYSDMIGEDIDDMRPGSNFGEIGKED